MPLEIYWSVLARRRLNQIYSYIERDSPEAAGRMIARVAAATEPLGKHPHLGRLASGQVRELVVGGTPYIIVYRVYRQQVLISTVLHGAQRRKS